MIKKIYSKLNTSILLNIIYTDSNSFEEINVTKRNEITEPGQFLQAMSIEIPANGQVKPHKHLSQERITTKTHEAILVLNGELELSVFDLDNSLIEKVILTDGDCAVTVDGGHSLKALTLVKIFEFKNGPYTGPEKDRTYFN